MDTKTTAIIGMLILALIASMIILRPTQRQQHTQDVQTIYLYYDGAAWVITADRPTRVINDEPETLSPALVAIDCPTQQATPTGKEKK